jgi:hypothetical protein
MRGLQWDYSLIPATTRDIYVTRGGNDYSAITLRNLATCISADATIDCMHYEAVALSAFVSAALQIVTENTYFK